LKHNKHSEQYWQEIFEDIDMEYLPVEYTNMIIITFEDGTKWEIDIKRSRSKQPIEQIEESLNELFEEYEDQITNLDFRMDMTRLRSELTKRVNRFIKLNK